MSASKARLIQGENIYRVINSVRYNDGYLINECRRKPTTGTRCPTFFDKWHRNFYMTSRTDTDGHTKAFLPSYGSPGGVKVLWQKAHSNRRPLGPHYSRTRQPPDHDDRPKSEDQLPRVLNGGGGGVLPRGGGSSAKTAPPRAGHPQEARNTWKSAFYPKDPCSLPIDL